MFHFPAFASDPLWIQEPDTLVSQPKMPTPAVDRPQGAAPRRSFATPVAEGGFPHSEIPGSKPVRGSPGLIAAYHVLHRLSAPRHPPDALLSLDRSHCRRTLDRTGSLLLLPVLKVLRRDPARRHHSAEWATCQRPFTSRDMSIRPRCGQTPRGHPDRHPRTRSSDRTLRRHLTSRPRSHPWNRNHRTCLLFTMTSRTSAPDAPSGEPAAKPFFVLGCSQDPTAPFPLGSRAGPVTEPAAQDLRRRWWSQTGSNRRPHACKARALPTELWPPGDLAPSVPSPGEPGRPTFPWTTIWWA